MTRLVRAALAAMRGLQNASLAGLLLLGSCFYLPPVDLPPESHAFPPSAESRIGRVIAEVPDALGRALVIDDPEFALVSRIELIDAADESLDVQYFIWQNDATGILVIQKLLAAADRGVRVRALVDDVQLEGLVDRLSALDAHPNIEIRIFNPFSVRLRYRLRVFRLAEFAIDGNRVNHRMHNKLLVADNHLAMLGGRNIGDDYFGQSENRSFIDTDILLSGEIVPALSEGFDTYWNGRWAYPVRSLISLSLQSDDLDALRERIRDRLAERPNVSRFADDHMADLRYEATFARLLEAPEYSWSTTIVDDPDIGWFERPDEIAAELTEFALAAEREILIVSPYFIPTPNMVGIAETLIERGVEISVLTNSLATNDVVIAQAAYSQFRKRIIDSGVALYEMRADPAFAEDEHADHVSLHSKYIIIDDDIVFIGSLNLDRRSLYLNTELGVTIESLALADQLRQSFKEMILPQNAWRVIETPDGLRWQSSAGTVDKQPAKSAWQRFQHDMLSLVPVSNQL